MEKQYESTNNTNATNKMEKILYKELSYVVTGICFKTHNSLGRFKSEKSYADYIEVLLMESKILYEREKPLHTSFGGEHSRRNIPDFVIDNKVILDVKAKGLVLKNDYYQMKRYLQVSNLKLGIIVNFRQPYIYPRRVLN